MHSNTLTWSEKCSMNLNDWATVEVPIGMLIAYTDQGIARELLIMC
jgi:hypothetical protein